MEALVLITRLSLSLMNGALQKTKSQQNAAEWKEPNFLPSEMN